MGEIERVLGQEHFSSSYQVWVFYSFGIGIFWFIWDLGILVHLGFGDLLVNLDFFFFFLR